MYCAFMRLNVDRNDFIIDTVKFAGDLLYE